MRSRSQPRASRRPASRPVPARQPRWQPAFGPAAKCQRGSGRHRCHGGPGRKRPGPSSPRR
eukprot:11295936-Alexandrium_andersonii.AAC.1